MKKILLAFLLTPLLAISTFAQKSDFNSWSLGFGGSGTLMFGDIKSFDSSGFKDFGYGGYLYVDKMFTPTFGIELKANYLTFKGESTGFSEAYDVLYTTNELDGFRFESTSYGGEFNVILNLSNISPRITNKQRKFNAAMYAGLGVHQYSSKLYNLKTDELEFAFGDSEDTNSSNIFSPYGTVGLGLKYRLSKRLDLELRQTVNVNLSDNLDGAISTKQALETFAVTNLGLVFKFGGKEKNAVWFDSASSGYKKSGTKKKKNKIMVDAYKDTDGDGVMDRFDKEPNTPPGVRVYGSGEAIDTDNDGIPDYQDACPFKQGLEDNGGCPEFKDSDNDGIFDVDDACPYEKGLEKNDGCPEEGISENALEKIANFSNGISFKSSSHELTKDSYATLDKIADMMKEYPATNFKIEGHTDNQGAENYNLFLSRRRAKAVKKYLVTQGVGSERLFAEGYGETRPKYPNDTPENRNKNRRVEIKKINENINIPTDDVDNVADSDNSGNSNDSNDSYDNGEIPDYHTVINGDTLFSLAKKYRTSVAKLKKLNNLPNTKIVIGTKLRLK
ncbi:OmpA family protein [Aureivirga sp. CE67]|uniref:OmpA family protein n=1 Tax=Aureivirga sp. CE67 TaxID=1788983 RepID=UPI0018CA337D|nr:OmpA family protein [Aureivirga sp. CE67]